MSKPRKRSSAGSDVPPPSGPDWQECMRTGLTHMRADHPEAAIDFFEQAIRLRPGYIPGRLNLAAAKLRCGQFRQALKVFDGVLATEHDCAPAHHGRGLALHALRKQSPALAAFRDAVRYDDEACNAWGSIADLTTDDAERLRALDRLARIRQQRCLVAAAEPSPFVQCARALIDAHHYHETIRWVKTHAAQFPDQMTAYGYLARAAYRLGAFVEAFHYQEQALLALAPESRTVDFRASRFSLDKALSALRAVVAMLEAHGMKPFLAAGTLLGVYREGHLLPHDRDVDLGILRNPNSRCDIGQLLRQHPDILVQRGYRSGDRYVAATFRGISLDIFLYDVSDGLVCGFSECPGDIQWRFTPFGLRQLTSQGQSWWAPDPPEQYLAETYGRDWQRPDTVFSSVVSSPALYDVSSYARAFYAAARAQQALLAGNETNARALLDQSPVPVRWPAVLKKK